ncbi:MAG: IS3 family transposase [Bacteroidales bacterium]|nr:IS3 family transposase [Bacteroidales bacterium]
MLRDQEVHSDMDTLCELFGKSRQAYYQRVKYNYKEVLKDEIVLQMIQKERKKMPRIGGRKLMLKIQPQLPDELFIGRDTFFDFLREKGLLIRKRRKYVYTTFSKHWLRKYPNLIVDFIPSKAHQLWVSDITYIQNAQGFSYLSLITDAYSRKIVGWSLGQTLEAKHSVKALEMAIKQLPKGISGVYHHSDRGVQYCSDEYVSILNKHHFQISMTENGDPLENAIAERVNGILKDEWLNQMVFKNYDEINQALKTIIQTYNVDRLHSSIEFLTPELAHYQTVPLERKWKNYYKKRNLECVK